MLDTLKNAVQQKQGLTLSAGTALELLERIEEIQRSENAAAVIIKRHEDREAAARELAHVLTLRLENIRNIARAAEQGLMQPTAALQRVLRSAEETTK